MYQIYKNTSYTYIIYYFLAPAGDKLKLVSNLVQKLSIFENMWRRLHFFFIMNNYFFTSSVNFYSEKKLFQSFFLLVSKLSKAAKKKKICRCVYIFCFNMLQHSKLNIWNFSSKIYIYIYVYKYINIYNIYDFFILSQLIKSFKNIFPLMLS